MTAHRAQDSYGNHGATATLTGRPGHWREAIFLIVNLVVFTAANAFWQYLATGKWYDFSAAAYRYDLKVPLGEALLHPLNVVSHPWMIPVVGLLLATVGAIPVLTAVLSRLTFAWILVAVVVTVGHAPVLAGALAIGCLVAARTPVRSDSPFLAVVLGLLPVGLYLYFLGLSDRQVAEVLPLQRWVLVGPLLVAMVVAVLAAAGSLALLKVTNSRLGVIWPVLAIMLAGATSIFYARIGSDELDCALIAEGLGPGDTIFQPVKLEQWRLEQGAEGLNQQTLEIRLQDHLQRLRQSLIGRCRRFVARHARSKRVGPVLWIEAQCQSLQLDVSAFQAGTVRYSASFPSSGSVRLWQQIGQECPGTPHAALADGRLGELALRRQDVKEADLRLQAAAKGLEGLLAAQRRAVMLEPETGLFQPAEAVPSLGYYAETLLRIRRLIWLMERNNVLNDPTDGEALAAMLNENPYEPQYEERLGRLAGRYEKTALGDNLKLAVAMATADPYGQAEMLIWLAEDERTDAAVEANYQLGMLVMQTARAHALRLIPKLKKPQDYFQIVIAAPPNPWTQLAREHLSRLEETPQEKPLALEADRQGK